MTNTSQKTEKTYFNLHTTGIGYLNRIREVTPKKGNPFIACNISALTGSSDEVEYRYFDLKVSGKEAKELVERCEAAVAAEKKVLVHFCIGDLWVDLFTYEKGKNKGETGYSLKGRLLRIDWIKIDGKVVYQSESKKTDERVEEQNASDVSEDSQTPEAVEAQAQAADVEETVTAAANSF